PPLGCVQDTTPSLRWRWRRNIQVRCLPAWRTAHRGDGVVPRASVHRRSGRRSEEEPVSDSPTSLSVLSPPPAVPGAPLRLHPALAVVLPQPVGVHSGLAAPPTLVPAPPTAAAGAAPR